MSHFNGQDGPLSLAGEVATGLVGIDWISGRLRTGLAMGMSRGAGSYQAAVNSGDIESKLSGLFPWAGYQLTDRLSVWAAAGYGAGVVTLTPQNDHAMTAELTGHHVADGIPVNGRPPESARWPLPGDMASTRSPSDAVRPSPNLTTTARPRRGTPAAAARRRPRP